MLSEPKPTASPSRSPARAEDGPQDVTQEPFATLHADTHIPKGMLAMLDKARSQLGVTEHTNGWTPYGAWYAGTVAHDKEFATADYCAMFQSWCAAQVGEAANVGTFAYCPWFAQWYLDLRHWGHSPHTGDLVFYNWSGQLSSPRHAEHVGLVESILSDGRIVAIEANTIGNAGDTLTGVWRRVRNPADVVVGYGTPDYSGVVPPAEDDDVAVGLGA